MFKERYYGDYRLLPESKESSRQLPPDAETSVMFEERIVTVLNKVLSQEESKSGIPHVDQLIVVSHQKVFECVSEKLTGNIRQLTQGGVAHYTWNQETHTYNVTLLN